jgi:hypothetical protein
MNPLSFENCVLELVIQGIAGPIDVELECTLVVAVILGWVRRLRERIEDFNSTPPRESATFTTHDNLAPVRNIIDNWRISINVVLPIDDIFNMTLIMARCKGKAFTLNAAAACRAL